MEIKIVSLGFLVDSKRPSSLNTALTRLLTSPLIKFNEAYSDFEDTLVEDSTAFDYWIGAINEFITTLGTKYKEKLNLMADGFLDSFKGILGEDTISQPLGDEDNVGELSTSMLVALAIRIHSSLIDYLGITEIEK